MKVIWQQITAFLLVLAIALTISAVRISNSMSQQVFDDMEKRLLNYGKSILENDFTRSGLDQFRRGLSEEGIYIQMYLSDGRIIYPTYSTRAAAELSTEELASLANGEILRLKPTQRLNEDDTVVRLISVFIPYSTTEGDFPVGFIGLSTSMEQLDSKVRAVQHDVYVSFFLAGALGVALSVSYAYYQTRKIKKLQRATRQITMGNYDVEVTVNSRDEFGDLAQDFRVMAKSLLDSQEEIKRQEKLRRQFMMDAAHEMRTPLTTMSGIVEGLQHDLIPETHRERSLELIGKETQRLIRLVNENLDYEKIRSNQLVLKKQQLNGKKFLTQIKEQLGDKATEKSNTIQVECGDDVMIWADYDRMVQIMINLVTNAIQFSQDSTIVIRAKKLSDSVEISVSDQGIGIDKEHIESIWERFYKADVSRKNTKFGESGIGLAVVKSLVEAHQGKIAVESEEGKGTTFTMHLPHPAK